MNILLLAAGEGKRFTEAGYPPKPLIEVNGVPMWLLVLQNLLTQLPLGVNPDVYVVTKEEYNIISSDLSNIKIVNLNGEQKGAAYSALQALYHVEPDQNDGDWSFYSKPLLILNCDQLIEFDGAEFLEIIEQEDPDGLLFHFIEKNKEEKWGRSIIDFGDFVIKKIVEKTPVSKLAHTGHYYFKSTSDFMGYAEDMIQNVNVDMKVNGEYFLSPIYNLMIEDGEVVVPFFVDKFIPLGIPEDLESYLND